MAMSVSVGTLAMTATGSSQRTGVTSPAPATGNRNVAVDMLTVYIIMAVMM